MWRRSGSYFYHLLLLLILLIEVGVIGVLSYSFYRQLSDITDHSETQVLQAAVIITFTCALILMIYTLLYQEISESRAARHHERYTAWSLRWSEIMLLGTTAPRGPLPLVAVNALLDQRTLVTGDYATVIEYLIQSYQLEKQWVNALRSPRIDLRLAALEALAIVQLPGTLVPVLHQLRHRRLIIRISAARTAARILAATPGLHARHAAVVYFGAALAGSQLPSGIVESLLLSLDNAGQPLLEYLFKKKTLAPDLLKGIILAAGHLRLVDMAPSIVKYIDYPIPAIRAAALQVLAKLGYLPAGAVATVNELVYSSDADVSLQAVRALALLPFEKSSSLLWDALAHPDWHVRCAVVYALLQYEANGLAVIQRAADTHPDMLARELVQGFLLDPDLQTDVRVHEWLWITT